MPYYIGAAEHDESHMSARSSSEPPGGVRGYALLPGNGCRRCRRSSDVLPVMRSRPKPLPAQASFTAVPLALTNSIELFLPIAS